MPVGQEKMPWGTLRKALTAFLCYFIFSLTLKTQKIFIPLLMSVENSC